jgi:hypothetical protein
MQVRVVPSTFNRFGRIRKCRLTVLAEHQQRTKKLADGGAGAAMPAGAMVALWGADERRLVAGQRPVRTERLRLQRVYIGCATRSVTTSY